MPDFIEPSELDRKYRVLRQTLGIHTILRDRFYFLSQSSEICLLISAVVFCAATFANDKVFGFLGVNPEVGTFILGIASISAFAASLTLMIVKPSEISERHAESARIWSKALAKFRDAWSDDGWDPEKAKPLSRAYWSASDSAASIPSGRRFVQLKSKYLLNVEISKLKSEYPGCPSFILNLMLRFSDTYKALRIKARSADEKVESSDDQT